MINWDYYREEKMYNYEYVQSLLKDYHTSDIDKEISTTETMNDQWYFEWVDTL